MPAEIFGEDYRFLRKEQLLSFAEIERLARLFSRLGVVKLKLTGGEPLLRPWLPALVERLKHLPGIEDLALITNGLLLKKMAVPLRTAGLDRVTVSLDSLDAETFAALSGRKHRLSQVLEGIDAAEAAGFSQIKLNVVVQRGVNDHEAVEFVGRFRHTGRTVRFIEFMDVGNRNGWKMDRVVPSGELIQRIGREYPLEPAEPHYPGEVASRYRLRDGSGEIGFISSISRPFCRGCTRARLTADGHLYTCLFARSGSDLRGMLREGAADTEILDRISGIWGERSDRYSEDRTAFGAGKEKKVEMYHIGG
jgi:cyclic pyranopterin phosphate synthase